MSGGKLSSFVEGMDVIVSVIMCSFIKNKTKKKELYPGEDSIS